MPTEPFIDAELLEMMAEPCVLCGRARAQGCGCWIDNPDHPWYRPWPSL